MRDSARKGLGRAGGDPGLGKREATRYDNGTEPRSRQARDPTLSSTRERLSEHFRKVRERDVRWIMQFNVQRLNRLLFPLLLLFLVLNFVDVSLTLLAIHFGPPFVELNQIASALFSRGFWGFMLALGLKYTPALPIAYGALLAEKPRRPVQVRVLKLAILVTLLAGNIYYAYVVANNTFNLLVFLG